LDLNGILSNEGTLALNGSEPLEIATFDPDSGSVLYESGSSITLPSALDEYYNLELSSFGAAVFTLPDKNLTVNGALSVTQGTLIFDNDKSLQVYGGVAVLAAGSLVNSGAGDFTLGGDLNNVGAVTFDSTGTSDSILIRSSAAGARRNWQGAGSFSFTDVDVQDQTVIGGTPASIGVVSGTDSGNNVNWIFALPITGTITLNGTGLSGVEVDGGTLGIQTTNSSGVYAFGNIGYGTSYTLTPSKSGHSFTPTAVSGLLTAAAEHNFTASLNQYTISGTVTENGQPLSAVSISSSELGTDTVTDSDGHYSFSNVPYGTNFTLTPGKENYAFTPTSAAGTISGDATYNFVGKLVGFDISGTITLENFTSDPLSGVTVTAAGKTAITDSSGNYKLEKVTVGTHTVTASLDSYFLAPEDGIEVDLQTGAVSDINFTAKPKLSNPAFAMWNGFLDMINVLEMMNLSSEDLTVTLRLYTIGGSGDTIDKTWTVPAWTQRDIIINEW